MAFEDGRLALASKFAKSRPSKAPDRRQTGGSLHLPPLVRHSLLESGYDIHTIQELLGIRGVRAAMIYTHVEPWRSLRL